MQKPESPFMIDRLVRISPREVVLEQVTQTYRSNIAALLQELHALLPRYWNCVDPGRYAYDQDEVMALTATYRDGSWDLESLEALMEDVKQVRQTFGDALSNGGAV